MGTRRRAAGRRAGRGHLRGEGSQRAAAFISPSKRSTPCHHRPPPAGAGRSERGPALHCVTWVPTHPRRPSRAQPPAGVRAGQIWEANWTIKLSREQSRSLETAGIHKREIFAFKTFKLYMAGPGRGRGRMGGGSAQTLQGAVTLGTGLGLAVLDLLSPKIPTPRPLPLSGDRSPSP